MLKARMLEAKSSDAGSWNAGSARIGEDQKVVIMNAGRSGGKTGLTTI